MRRNNKHTRAFFSLLFSLFCLVTFFGSSAFATQNTLTLTDINSTDLSAQRATRIGIYRFYSDTASNRGVTEDFLDSGISVVDYNKDPYDVTQRLSSYVKNNSIDPIKTETVNDAGQVSFANLDDGIYLLLQMNTAEDYKDYLRTITVSPLAVRIPITDSSTYENVYNVRAKAKVIETPNIDNLINIDVYNYWDDADNKCGKRPSEIEVVLYLDGEPYDSVILNSDNNWSHSWVNLDPNHDWDISYDNVEFYRTSGGKSDEYTFEIYNVIRNCAVSPRTLDDIVDWVTLLIIFASCLLLSFIYLHRAYQKTT